MRKILLLTFSLLILSAESQVVYEDINNVGIYEFLDELANLRVIQINSVVKPYSRQFIAEKLMETYHLVSGEVGESGSGKGKRKEGKRAVTLNKRQMKELLFYLQDYQIDLRCGIWDTGYAKSKKRKAKSEIDNLQPTTDCPIEYDHKLGFLFKKKPAFAVPLNPLAFQYKGKLFTFSARPILGFTYMSNENGSASHMYWGW